MSSKWSPLNCCCIFYTAKTGTKILLHLELVFLIIGYIVLFVGLIAGKTFVVESLEILLEENWMARLGFPFLVPDKNVHTDLYQEYKQALLISLPLAFLYLLFVIIPGLIALRKKKPYLLIPYLLYKILMALGMIAIVVIIHFNMTNYITEQRNEDRHDSSFWLRIREALVPTKRTEKHLKTSVGYAIYASFILSVLLTVLHFHFALVIATCYRDMREEIKDSRKLKNSTSKKIHSKEEFVHNVT